MNNLTHQKKEIIFKIRNANWTLENLRNNFTQKVWDLHCQYSKDPNCSPDLYCHNEDMSEGEKASFIYLVHHYALVN